MVKVKICGITNIEDALHAVNHGADMLGFNFYEQSPRSIDPYMAKTIIEELPTAVEKIGVFVNMDKSEIVDIVDLVGLDSVQLHGDERPTFVEELGAVTNAMLIRAIRVQRNFLPNSIVEYGLDSILLDAYAANQYGGTGDRFDWKSAMAVKELIPFLYLAGGLKPEDVADAVRTVRPYAVDVASGVESSPGKKDPKLVEAFITNAKNA